jgi:hypothetical protein
VWYECGETAIWCGGEQLEKKARLTWNIFSLTWEREEGELQVSSFTVYILFPYGEEQRSNTQRTQHLSRTWQQARRHCRGKYNFSHQYNIFTYSGVSINTNEKKHEHDT